MEDQPPPSKKRKTTKALGDHFVTPLSPSSMDRVCRGFVPKNTKLAGLCACFSSGGCTATVLPPRVVPKISWNNQNLSCFTIGLHDLW